jgi:hypothetical protein
MKIRTIRIVGTPVWDTLEVQFQEVNGDNIKVLCSLRVSELVQEVGDLITLFMHRDTRFIHAFENYMAGKDIL